MSKRQPIAELIESDKVSEERKEKLNSVLQIREFASSKLALPDNASYTTFVDLDRDYVTWVVFATSELSLQAETWCFLIVGCVPYRGYFELQKAQQFSDELKQQGLEVYIAPVPAYSTLGWFSDPMLSSMLDRGSVDVVAAEYIFHELAHQQLYIKNDTNFNEAFATAVGRLGVIAWLNEENKSTQLQKYLKRIEEKQQLYQIIDQFRERLHDIYDSSLPDHEKRAQKRIAYNLYKEEMRGKITSWGKFDVYENWVLKDINNAKLSALSTYQALVPEFITLFGQCDNDFAVFYQTVELAKKQPKEQRLQFLRETGCND